MNNQNTTTPRTDALKESLKTAWFDSPSMLEQKRKLFEHSRQLERELSETKRLLEYKNETANTFMNQVKKLQAELEELRKDKERLDWLQTLKSEMSWRKGLGFIFHNGNPNLDYVMSDNSIRELIDKAIKSEEKP